MTTRTRTRARTRVLLFGGAIVVLVVAMALSTKVVSKTEAQQAESHGLDPAAFALDKYSSAIAPVIIKNAIDVATVAAAIKADPADAAKKYGQHEGSSAPVFSVEAKGVAGAVDAGGLMLVTVPGMPTDIKVYVQMGPAINGTAIRDATGTVHFQQFVNQLDYQAASDRLNDQVKALVLKGVDAASLDGKNVDIIGAFQLGNPAAYLLTPVRIGGGQ